MPSTRQLNGGRTRMVGISKAEPLPPPGGGTAELSLEFCGPPSLPKAWYIDRSKCGSKRGQTGDKQLWIPTPWQVNSMNLEGNQYLLCPHATLPPTGSLTQHPLVLQRRCWALGHSSGENLAMFCLVQTAHGNPEMETQARC